MTRPAKPRNMRTVLLSITLSLACLPSLVSAQTAIPIYDARRNSEPAKVSKTDVAAIERLAIPAARQALGGECEPEIDYTGTASGSFTAPGRTQRIVLYRYCETGHGFANNGLVVFEGGSIVRHVIYNGGSEMEILALPDIDQNGISELVIAGGSTNQGYTVSAISILELSNTGARDIGDADAYEDNCGVVDRCKMTAYRILAQPGTKPKFFREIYQKRGGKWVGTSVRRAFSLRKSYQNPPTEYKILN